MIATIGTEGRPEQRPAAAADKIRLNSLAESSLDAEVSPGDDDEDDDEADDDHQEDQVDEENEDEQTDGDEQEDDEDDYDDHQDQNQYRENEVDLGGDKHDDQARLKANHAEKQQAPGQVAAAAKWRQWRKRQRRKLNRTASTVMLRTSSSNQSGLNVRPLIAFNRRQRLLGKKSKVGQVSSSSLSSSSSVAATTAAPRLEAAYQAKIRENERQLREITPKLRVASQTEEAKVEICDFELSSYDDQAANNNNNNSKTSQQQPFVVSWIDRINGDILIEAKEETLINCELRQSYLLRMRAIGCNGLASNE